MANVSINLTKWWHVLLLLIPFFGSLATAAMWLDTRYMHRQISDSRYIETQIKIIEGQMRDYHRIMDSGGVLSQEDMLKFELDKEQLKNLQKERNKILGIGEFND